MTDSPAPGPSQAAHRSGALAAKLEGVLDRFPGARSGAKGRKEALLEKQREKRRAMGLNV
jgi:hypothetical protein